QSVLAQVTVAEAEQQWQPVGPERDQETAIHFRRGESPQIPGKWVLGERAAGVEVRALARDAIPVRVYGGHDGEGLGRLIGGNAGKLPAAEDLLDPRRLRPIGLE